MDMIWRKCIFLSSLKKNPLVQMIKNEVRGVEFDNRVKLFAVRINCQLTALLYIQVVFINTRFDIFDKWQPNIYDHVHSLSQKLA